MRTTTQPHGLHYEFDNGYTLSVVTGWGAMADESRPYEFMAWGNGMRTDAIGYRTKADIDHIIDIFDNNKIEAIDKFFAEYSWEEPVTPECPTPLIAVVVSYQGGVGSYDSDSTIRWRVHYIDAESGREVEDLRFTGQFDLFDDEAGGPSDDAVVAHACTYNNSIYVLAIHRF